MAKAESMLSSTATWPSYIGRTQARPYLLLSTPFQANHSIVWCSAVFSDDRSSIDHHILLPISNILLILLARRHRSTTRLPRRLRHSSNSIHLLRRATIIDTKRLQRAPRTLPSPLRIRGTARRQQPRQQRSRLHRRLPWRLRLHRPRLGRRTIRRCRRIQDRAEEVASCGGYAS